jgi:hypothetical protein
VVPFRQPIRPNDVGLDVMAVKRAMIAMGAQDSQRIVVNRRAGAAFVHTLKAIEHNNKLTVDGIYGPKVHAIVAPHFDLWGAQLYRKAGIRDVHPFHANPLHLAKNIGLSRTDMGVDYHGEGPICSFVAAKYLGNSGRGWPGNNFMLFEVKAGPFKGKFFYIAEAVEPVVSRGALVDAGQPVCRFGYYAARGRYPGIEMGWASESGLSQINKTRAAETSGYYEGERTPAGKAFARLLRSVGCSTLEDPGPGPMYV